MHTAMARSLPAAALPRLIHSRIRYPDHAPLHILSQVDDGQADTKGSRKNNSPFRATHPFRLAELLVRLHARTMRPSRASAGMRLDTPRFEVILSRAQSVTIVVLGDLGRSPRVLYRAQALLDRSVTVDLVGYAMTPLPAPLLGHACLRTHWLRALELPAATFSIRNRTAKAYRARPSGAVETRIVTPPRQRAARAARTCILPGQGSPLQPPSRGTVGLLSTIRACGH